jgi:hypothetical protein
MVDITAPRPWMFVKRRMRSRCIEQAQLQRRLVKPRLLGINFIGKSPLWKNRLRVFSPTRELDGFPLN